ncbi:hypothetical protein [Streptomyces triticiradicis]|uniref:Uncharacterized protein n=1 Tax=Streptomyces triticiradicis TaxID=2651189 RepID=A0A7J5D7J3_9ACTN|nr:hypothetical protein [Streptomyces triticiradicis]KAB1979239.1 hypothetical protein F8144_36355 [Streptomyces triticiradicis]
MAKGGKPKKKLQVPPAPVSEQKRTGDPALLLPSGASSGERVCWRFTHLDREGPWGLHSLDHARLLELISEMVKFESQTINELFRQGEWPGKCHDVPQLPNRAALDRLDAIGLADMTKIWKLRIGGKGRLWGFLVGNVFHVVWWDPEHEVWPSKLRNT